MDLFFYRDVESVYVKSLERCHAQLVYDNWPYNQRTTVDIILLRNGSAAFFRCVFERG